MKPLVSRILIVVAVLALAVSASAAPKAKSAGNRDGGLKGSRVPPPPNKEEAIKDALGRFTALSAHYENKYPDHPEYQKVIRDARVEFENRAGAFLPNQPYRPKELEVMAELVDITVRQLAKATKLLERAAATGMSAHELNNAQKELKIEGRREMVTAFVTAGLAPMLPEPPKPDTLAVDGAAAIRSNPNRGEWNGAFYDNDEQGLTDWEKRIGDTSPIAILGVKSTKCAADPSNCKIDPPFPPTPEPVVPVPGQGNPRPGGGGTGGGAAPPTSGPSTRSSKRSPRKAGPTRSRAAACWRSSAVTMPGRCPRRRPR